MCKDFAHKIDVLDSFFIHYKLLFLFKIISISTYFILFKLLERNTQSSQTVFHFFGDEAWTNFNTLLMKYRK